MKAPLTIAPRDGTVIRLWLANAAEPVLARWSPQMQGWVRDGDPLRRVLHGVVAWEGFDRGEAS